LIGIAELSLTIEKATSLFLVSVYIDLNNQNVIAIVVVRLNIDGDFLSREWNCAHLNDAKEKQIIG
jgi:hypothetical protein